MDLRFVDNPEDQTFRNENLKRVRTQQGSRNQPLEAQAVVTTSKPPAPIEITDNRISMDTDKPQPATDLSPNSDRLTRIENRMQDTFANLGSLTEMIQNVFPKNSTPYIEEDTFFKTNKNNQ